MLPRSRLSFSLAGGLLIPRLLTPRDEAWVRRLLDEAPAFAGRTLGAWRHAVAEELHPGACADGAHPRASLGVLHLLEEDWETRVDSPLPPARVRRAVYECATRHVRRQDAIEAAATELGLTAAAVEAALFADRREAHVLGSAAWPSAADLIERYNLRLVQGLVLHARSLDVHVREHARAVVRYAKLKRLLCTYELTARGTALAISGPLAVLRHTTKYGHALASFLESAIATPGWALEATCELGAEPARLRLSACDLVSRRHALPRDADSALERRLVADVRKLGAGWQIDRETAAIPLPDEVGRATVFFPDFTLTRGDDRVLVEVVGYYTPEYLASKLRALRAVAVPIVVCVDEKLAAGLGEHGAGETVRFSGRVPAGEVLAAAERLAGARARTAAPLPLPSPCDGANWAVPWSS